MVDEKVIEDLRERNAALNEELAKERKYNSDLVMNGRCSVDREKLFERVYMAATSALQFVVVKTAIPFIDVGQAMAEINPVLQQILAELIIPYEAENLTDFSTWWGEFEAYREGIDEEHVLDEFDLALGWFAGKGLSYDQALQAAGTAREKWGGA